MRARFGRAGTGLLEAVTATAVIVTAAATLAALASLALSSVRAGRDRTTAAIAAYAKLEALQTTRLPLSASPPDSLDRDLDGWHDHLGPGGESAAPASPPHGTVFVRRWRIAAYPGQEGLVTITVLVSRCGRSAAGGQGCASRADAVRASGLRSERAW